MGMPVSREDGRSSRSERFEEHQGVLRGALEEIGELITKNLDETRLLLPIYENLHSVVYGESDGCGRGLGSGQQ